jgi:hypothetical protein
MAERVEQPGVDRPIRRDDIEDRLRSLRGEIDNVKASTLGAGIAAGFGAVLLLIILAFLLGKRRAKKKYAFIEIKRV